ncbi:MAG: hypothetical protein B6I20_05495 [Bacteroidetes bacterium 4572_117]|nr:MAG: hypothetical protein B6I20_05495 [Bacteroidetes bacterium 4572_117]
MKQIEYFNDQYSGVLHTAPVLFIEFPDALQFETLDKTTQQALFKVRIHAVGKVMHKADKSISESSLETHFGICNDIWLRLQGFRAEDSGKMTFNSLARTTFEHHQELSGFMVTYQDFEGVVYSYAPDKQAVAKPSVEIIKT